MTESWAAQRLRTTADPTIKFCALHEVALKVGAPVRINRPRRGGIKLSRCGNFFGESRFSWPLLDRLGGCWKTPAGCRSREALCGAATARSTGQGLLEF